MCWPTVVSHYKKQDNAWYYGNAKIEGADLKSFRVLDDPQRDYIPCETSDTYAADKFHVYSGGTILSGADPASFSLLYDNYARDARHAYYLDAPISNDGASFARVGSTDFFKDARHVYFEGKVINDADAATFAPFKNANFPPGGGGLAHDASHVFVGLLYPNVSLISIASANDVKVLGNIYWISNRTIFFADKPLPQADVASFVVAKEGEYAFTAEDKDHYFSDDLLHHRVLNKSECKKIGPSVIACKDYILAAGQKYVELDAASLHYLGMKDGWWTYEDKHGIHRVSGDGFIDGGSFARDPRDFSF